MGFVNATYLNARRSNGVGVRPTPPVPTKGFTMANQIKIHEDYWQNTMKAMDELLEKVAQDIVQRENLPIEEARTIAVRCLAVAIERKKMERPIV